MFRARRDRQIAEANQNVFSSDAGVEWWLAEPKAQQLPAQAATKNKPAANQSLAAAVSLPQPERPSTAVVRPSEEIGSGLQPAASHAAHDAAPREQVALEESRWAPKSEDGGVPDSSRTFDGDGDNLTWDAKVGCFVASR